MDNELLTALEQNVDLLIADNKDLRERVFALAEQNERLRQEMIRSHEELAAAQREKHILETANAMTGSENGREEAKKQLTRLINQVDKIINQITTPAWQINE